MHAARGVLLYVEAGYEYFARRCEWLPNTAKPTAKYLDKCFTNPNETLHCKGIIGQLWYNSISIYLLYFGACESYIGVNGSFIITTGTLYVFFVENLLLSSTFNVYHRPALSSDGAGDGS